MSTKGTHGISSQTSFVCIKPPCLLASMDAKEIGIRGEVRYQMPHQTDKEFGNMVSRRSVRRVEHRSCRCWRHHLHRIARARLARSGSTSDRAGVGAGHTEALRRLPIPRQKGWRRHHRCRRVDRRRYRTVGPMSRWNGWHGSIQQRLDGLHLFAIRKSLEDGQLRFERLDKLIKLGPFELMDERFYPDTSISIPKGGKAGYLRIT